MRVSIPKGYRVPIEKLMSQLQTDDPALAVNHIVGCWIAAGGCPGHGVAAAPNVANQSTADEFADIIEY